MKLELNIKSLDNVGELTPEKKAVIVEIFESLIVTGSLTGVKGGQVILHFDPWGEYKGVQLTYWPWVRRQIDTKPQSRYNKPQ